MKNKAVKNIIIKLMLITSIIYILWRVVFTIPFKFGIPSLVIGIIFLIIELIEFFEFVIHYINVLKIDEKKIRHKKDYKQYADVDVIIATINEEEELLEKTVQACIEMNYPDKNKVHIYICDDGNRENIRKMAERKNVGYITRNNNENAKAGNYNNALKYLKSQYILTLDADMCPLPDFLIETMPYFAKNEKVGFVQTPQAFYNLDIYQNRFGTKDTIPFDQNFFYHGIQSAKSISNTTVYCGTNAILSREALDNIGGFAIGTLTEDIATGMLIEASGYKGIYLDKVLAVGYSTNDINSFVKQRKRWAFGCIQMGKKYPINKQKGLNIKQKLEYLSCISYWFFSVKTLLYLIAPILFSVFNIVIIQSNMIMFLIMWLPQYFLKRFMLDKIYSNKRSSTWNKIYETILFPVLFWGVIRETLGIKKRKFEVSDKTNKNTIKNTAGIRLFIYHAIFLLINLLSFVVSIKNTYILPCVFSLINIGYLLMAIIFDLNNNTNIEQNKNMLKTDNKYSLKSILYIFKEIKV